MQATSAAARAMDGTTAPSNLQSAPQAKPPQSQPQSAGSYSAGSASPSSSSSSSAISSWFDPNDPYCRQGCTYDKANENLTLLTRYTQNKLQLIEGLMRKNRDAEVEEALGDFCFSSETLDDCWARFQRYQYLQLSKMRRAIQENETSGSKLMSKRVDAAKGVVEGDDIAVVQVEAPRDGTAPKSILPYFASLKELKEAYEKDSRLRSSITQGFAQWLEEYPVKPSPSDFVLTKEILRDPTDPKRGTFTVVAMEADGKTPKIDKKAYQAALRAYQNATKRLSLSDRDKVKKAYPVKRGPVVKNKFAPDEVSEAALNQARGEFVDEANRMIRGLPRAKRAPGSILPRYTGDEKIERPAGGGSDPSVRGSDTLIMDTQGMRSDLIHKIRTKVGGEKLPPPPSDVNGNPIAPESIE